MLARCLVWASFVVFGDECTWLPIVTSFVALIIENIGLSPEVLPVMSINTLSFVMLLVEWTPLSLEVKHIKIYVFFHLMDQSCFELFSTMRE
jgi:hypothetical protein